MKLLMVILTIMLCIPNLQGQDWLQPKLEIYFLYGLGDYDITVSDFPLKLRSVPLHEDDGYLSNYSNATEPLPDSRLFEESKLGGAFSIIYYPAFFIGWGAMLHFKSDQEGDGWPSSDGEGRFQQNQWGGSGRQYGASLRYYEIRRDLTVVKFNLNLNTGFRRIWEFVCVRGKAVVIWDPIGRDLAARAGWDRFGGDQDWQEISLGRLHEHAGVLEFNLGLFSGSGKKENDEDNDEDKENEKIGGVYFTFGVSRYFQWYSLPEDVSVDISEIQKWVYSFSINIGF